MPTDTIKSLTKQLERLSKIRDREGQLAKELKEAREEALSTKQQLARTNVKDLAEANRRQSRLQEAREEEFPKIHDELIHKDLSLRALRATNARVIQQYIEIFRAHYEQQQKSQRKASAAAQHGAQKAVVGPNSDLNLQYYQTRYNETMQELVRAQKKLKQIILLSHQDHLNFTQQKEALIAQLEVMEGERGSKSSTCGTSHQRHDGSHSQDDCSGGLQISSRTYGEVVPFESFKSSQLQEVRRNFDRTLGLSLNQYDRVDSTLHLVREKTLTVTGANGNDFSNPLSQPLLARVSQSGEASEISARALSEDCFEESTKFLPNPLAPKPVKSLAPKHVVYMGSTHVSSKGAPASLAARNQTMSPARRPHSAVL
jgi:hypothetical protein